MKTIMLAVGIILLLIGVLLAIVGPCSPASRGDELKIITTGCVISALGITFIFVSQS
jgi:hypothetical protein